MVQLWTGTENVLFVTRLGRVILRPQSLCKLVSGLHSLCACNVNISPPCGRSRFCFLIAIATSVRIQCMQQNVHAYSNISS